VSERCNRTLLDMVRSMMSLTKLSLSFWGYGVCATFIMNRSPSKSVETDLYELWHEKKRNMHFLKTLGMHCVCSVHNQISLIEISDTLQVIHMNGWVFLLASHLRKSGCRKEQCVFRLKSSL